MKRLSPYFAFLFFILAGCASHTEESSEKTEVQESESITHHIDHIIVAINNLDSGVAMFERLTGIKPVIGGEHPGRGTHNALVAIGEKTYLEIIAPRQNLDSAEYQLSAFLLAYEELTPTGWAVNSSDPELSKQTVIGASFSASNLSAGGRIKPDGTELSWTTFGIEDEINGKPFFIKWGEGSAHPATTSPPGIELLTVSITTPEAEKLRSLVDVLGIDMEISEGEFSMSLELSTPNGPIDILGQAYNNILNPN